MWVLNIMNNCFLVRKTNIFAELFICSLFFLAQSCLADSLTVLNDDELSNVSGQALLNLAYTQGTDLSGTGGQNQSNLGFYRLGMEAQIDLNANIKKLQLGCGGSKGAGCDIDIDNVALTGITSSNAQGAGVGTDFQLKNPFIEFAIANPNSSATRNVIGFRLGALAALGMMSLGSNGDTSTLSDDTGINSLSGDIGINVTNAKIRNVKVASGLATIDATIQPYNNVLAVNRSSSFSLTGLTAITDAVKIFGILNLPLGITLHANMNNIPFSTVHRLQVSDANGNPTSGAYLSLQSQNINWQNVSTGAWNNTAAQKGWWLSIPQTTFQNLNIDGSSVNIPLLDAAAGILGSTIQFPGIDLGQMPVNNCYGKLKFC